MGTHSFVRPSRRRRGPLPIANAGFDYCSKIIHIIAEHVVDGANSRDDLYIAT
jgi:hypothetical protein